MKLHYQSRIDTVSMMMSRSQYWDLGFDTRIGFRSLKGNISIIESPSFSHRWTEISIPQV